MVMSYISDKCVMVCDCRKLSSTWSELSGLENPKKTANKQYQSERCSRELSDRTMRVRLAAAAVDNNR